MKSAADARERLLRSGLAIARRSGLRAVTVRGTAARARVNLGSFVHHFGTREAFVGELLERWYAPLIAQLAIVEDRAMPPKARLRELLLQTVEWARGNADFLGHVLQDAAHGETAARRFLAGVRSRHPALLLAAIRGAQDAGELRKEAPLHSLMFLMSVLTLPLLLFGGGGVQRALPRDFARELALLAIERVHIEQRLDWALRGLAP